MRIKSEQSKTTAAQAELDVRVLRRELEAEEKCGGSGSRINSLRQELLNALETLAAVYAARRYPDDPESHDSARPFVFRRMIYKYPLEVIDLAYEADFLRLALYDQTPGR